MLLDYLYKNYMSQTEFCREAKLTDQQLSDLQNKLLLPTASYQLKTIINCQSFTGEFDQTVAHQFYHPNYIKWHKQLISDNVTTKRRAFGTFKRAYEMARADFIGSDIGRDIVEIFTQNTWKLSPVENIWAHFNEGTFGLCTKSGLPDHIFLKQIHGSFIRHITSKFLADQIPPEIAGTLRRSVDELDKVTSCFAPHEVKNSSRQTNIVNIRHDYLNRRETT